MSFSDYLSDINGIIVERIQKLLFAEIIVAHSRKPRTQAGNALFALLVRNANSWRSINVLVQSCVSEEMFSSIALDCGAIIRCMYDALLQGLFIVQDPMRMEERGKLYLEYSHVERYRQSTSLVDQPNSLSQTLSQSKLRAAGEACILAKYKRVESAYRDEGKKRPRNHWYAGNLYQLAEMTGRKDEYQWLINRFHGCVHSGPYAVFNGPGLPGRMTPYIAMSTAAQSAKLFTEHGEVALSSESTELLNNCARPFLEICDEIKLPT
jgi:hypothetical protein